MGGRELKGREGNRSKGKGGSVRGGKGKWGERRGEKKRLTKSDLKMLFKEDKLKGFSQ